MGSATPLAEEIPAEGGCRPGSRRAARELQECAGSEPVRHPRTAGVPQGRGVRGGAHVPSPCRQASRDLGGARGPAAELGMRFTPCPRLPFQTLQSNALPAESPNHDGGRGGPRSSKGGPPVGGARAPALGGRLRRPPTCPPLTDSLNASLLSLFSF